VEEANAIESHSSVQEEEANAIEVESGEKEVEGGGGRQSPAQEFDENQKCKQVEGIQGYPRTREKIVGLQKTDQNTMLNFID
jgi:hypothetical protein